MKATQKHAPTPLLIAIGAALAMSAGALHAAESADDKAAVVNPDQVIAQQAAHVLRSADTAQRSLAIDAIRKRGGSLTFTELDLTLDMSSVSDGMESPVELELVDPRNTRGAPIGVFYMSNDDREENFRGYSLVSGREITRSYVELTEGNEPFLMVDRNGSVQLSELIEASNIEIRRQLAQFQRPGSLGGSVEGKRVADASRDAKPGAESTRSAAKDVGDGPGEWSVSLLHSARADDRIHEAGNAEVYAIIVGLSHEGEPLMEVVQWPWFDRRYTTYIPDQVLTHWMTELTEGDIEWHRAPWLEMVIMEHDNDHSYQEAIQVALTKITEVAVAAGGNPVIGMAGAAASAIVGALPSKWFRNDDDYLDAFYSIEYNEELNQHGVNNNINLHIVPEVYGFHDADLEVDLKLHSVVAQAGNYFPHQTVQTSISVQNIGNGPSAAWEAKFYLIPAYGPGPGIFLAEGNAPALGAGQASHHEFQLPLNAPGVVAGTYRLRAEIEVVDDVNPINNARQAVWGTNITVLTAPAPGDLLWAKPDLEADYIVGVAGDYYPTDTVQTWFGVDNIGGAAGNWEAHFWAVNQTNGQVSYLAKGTSGGLASGDSYAGVVDVPLTALSMGTYKLVLQVAGLAGEASTSNNIIPSIGTIEILPSVIGN